MYMLMNTVYYVMDMLVRNIVTLFDKKSGVIDQQTILCSNLLSYITVIHFFIMP